MNRAWKETKYFEVLSLKKTFFNSQIIFFWNDYYNLTLYCFLEFSFGVITGHFSISWCTLFGRFFLVDRTISYDFGMYVFRINLLSCSYIHTYTHRLEIRCLNNCVLFLFSKRGFLIGHHMKGQCPGISLR